MNIQLPEKLKGLFQPARYKIAYGGRGSAKSWSVARTLLTLGANRPLRIPCGREFQSSIADSVHALLEGQTKAMGLSKFYDVQKTQIVGRNGTQFTFHGLHHNVNNIKSLEGADICWVEEANTVSKDSWEKLTPTIRKDNSEIWITFNPELVTDITYQKFIVRPPTGAMLLPMNWRDNPWFNDILRQEMEDLKRDDYDAYLNVWEGACKKAVEGAIYAKEISKAETEGRLGRVPYIPGTPVNTFWDLGWSDMTTVWFVQKIGYEWHVIDYYQNRQTTIEQDILELQKRAYVYGTDYLPHDGGNSTKAAKGGSLEQQARALGRRVVVQKNLGIADGLNAARTVFGQCHFDAEKCADGIQALRHYRYKVDKETGQFSRHPEHDWASHAADAFRGFAVSTSSLGRGAPPKRSNSAFADVAAGGGWMGG